MFFKYLSFYGRKHTNSIKSVDIKHEQGKNIFKVSHLQIAAIGTQFGTVIARKHAFIQGPAHRFCKCNNFNQRWIFRSRHLHLELY